MGTGKTYVAIDLKSFYASVECVERGLDPLDTNLVVADPTRTEKTICLAVTPSLKAYGISGRARLFEVVQRIKEINAIRLSDAPGKQFSGESFSDRELKADPSLSLSYITAPPQMRRYMEISSLIYEIYLKYIAPEDIHVYSIDEVFINATDYLTLYKQNANEFVRTIIKDVWQTTGITATAGIGTNLYLSKIAMDIDAKHMQADEYGVRVASLDEISYRERLWSHKPLTDFWRIGRGYYKKLTDRGIYTMGDVARCSLDNEEMLYKLFGVNAELLIDHAWGIEPVGIDEIKAYTPGSRSVSSGQVLKQPYVFEKARLICKEMTDSLVLDLVEKRLVTDQLVLTVCYDIENVTKGNYSGKVKTDFYGRSAPDNSHGSINLGVFTSSTKTILAKMLELFDRIVCRELTVRRIYVVANHVRPEWQKTEPEFEQLSLFDSDAFGPEKEEDSIKAEKEKSIQNTIIGIKNRYGKNAILKAVNFEEGAMTIERNGTVGGHKA